MAMKVTIRRTTINKKDAKIDEQMQIVAGIKNRFFQDGLMLERITFADWIKHIEEIEA